MTRVFSAVAWESGPQFLEDCAYFILHIYIYLRMGGTFNYVEKKLISKVSGEHSDLSGEGDLAVNWISLNVPYSMCSADLDREIQAKSWLG